MKDFCQMILTVIMLAIFLWVMIIDFHIDKISTRLETINDSLMRLDK